MSCVRSRYTYTLRSLPGSFSRVPRWMRFILAASVAPSLRAASLTVTLAVSLSCPVFWGNAPPLRPTATRMLARPTRHRAPPRDVVSGWESPKGLADHGHAVLCSASRDIATGSPHVVGRLAARRHSLSSMLL